MISQAHWMTHNDQHLAATVAWIHARLEQLAHGGDVTASPAIQAARQDMLTLEDSDTPPALTLLGNALGLSQFDRQLLALCAAMELHTRTAALCAQAQDDPGKPYPCFALAFTLFDDPDWSVLAPHGPLRHWRLLEIHQSGAQPLTSAALTLDERILNYLKGLNYLDDRLAPFLTPLPTPDGHAGPLPTSQQQQADALLATLQQSAGRQTQPPIIELTGQDTASKQRVAAYTAQQLGVQLQHAELKSLPSHTTDLDTFIRLWQRECQLLPLTLFIDAQDIDSNHHAPLQYLLDRSQDIVFLDTCERMPNLNRQRISLEIHKPTPVEQQQLWREALPAADDELPRRLAEQFSFNPQDILQLATGAHADPTTLWQQCRIAARTGMEQLAQRIHCKAHWQQLILPAQPKRLLQQITHQVGCRSQVYEEWGFRQRLNRGLGISALFCGDSGTGKTMAAEVIANTLQLDLYRIDLSSVVSKYIGETEKNLRKLFDTAEDSGAILFFDEADALFGKRSEVKDSHDRYANIEINYLLQRMESYRGLAILASNMKSSLDKAFVRRLRFIVDFPFPGSEERAQIWRSVFPHTTPMGEDIDWQQLAKLKLTGGNIHSIAINAAFLAAQQNTPVTMSLLLSAARDEYKKLERPVKDSDFSWKEGLGVAI